MVQKTKVIKKSSKTKDDDNINITNDINIKIDLETDEKPKPKKKRSYKRKQKPLEELDKLGNGAVSGVSNVPRKLGSTKIPSDDTNFNPNTTTNMIVSSAIQNAFGNRPNFLSNPLAPPALPPPPVIPALPAPVVVPAITAPPVPPPLPAPPVIPAITAPPVPPPLPPPPALLPLPSPPIPSGSLTVNELERLARLYIGNQPTSSSSLARFTRLGSKGGILGRPRKK